MTAERRPQSRRVAALSDDEFLAYCQKAIPLARDDVADIYDLRHALAGLTAVAGSLLHEADRRLGVTRDSSFRRSG